MNGSKFEAVSSLVDEYQHTDDSSNLEFDEIIEDEQLSGTWERYHLIGDVMRDDVTETIELDLSASIANAIADEPTILAPRKPSPFIAEFKAKVVQFAKPFGQMAIAASAAGLMVLGVQQNNMAETEPLVPTQNFQTNPLGGGYAEPVSLNFQKTDRVSQKQAYLMQQRRFHALLSDHQQQMKLHAYAPANSSETSEQESPKKEENTPK